MFLVKVPLYKYARNINLLTTIRHIFTYDFWCKINWFGSKDLTKSNKWGEQDHMTLIHLFLVSPIALFYFMILNCYSHKFRFLIQYSPDFTNVCIDFWVWMKCIWWIQDIIILEVSVENLIAFLIFKGFQIPMAP